jgi:hypothetical protein
LDSQSFLLNRLFDGYPLVAPMAAGGASGPGAGGEGEGGAGGGGDGGAGAGGPGGGASGFAVGSTVRACTKGVWVMAKRLPLDYADGDPSMAPRGACRAVAWFCVALAWRAFACRGLPWLAAVVRRGQADPSTDSSRLMWLCVHVNGLQVAKRMASRPSC